MARTKINKIYRRLIVTGDQVVSEQNNMINRLRLELEQVKYTSAEAAPTPPDIKLASLVTAAGGALGSHLVLYKLAGHPEIATLKESSFRSQEGGTTKRDLKDWFAGKNNVIPRLQGEQLEPQKDLTGNNVKWIFVNKPTIKNCIYHRSYCESYPMFYIFRN